MRLQIPSQETGPSGQPPERAGKRKERLLAQLAERVGQRSPTDHSIVPYMTHSYNAWLTDVLPGWQHCCDSIQIGSAVGVLNGGTVATDAAFFTMSRRPSPVRVCDIGIFDAVGMK